MRELRVLMIIVLLFTVLVVISMGVTGRTLILEDDFTGNDLQPPDSSKWVVDNDGSGDRLSLDNNTLRCTCPHPPYGHHPGVFTKDPIVANNITATVELQVHSYYWQPFALTIMTNISGTDTPCAALTYQNDHGWFLATYSGTSSTYHSSNLKTLDLDEWYILELTINSNTVDAKITERDTGSQMWSISGKTTNQLRGDNKVNLKTGGGDCSYDDFALYDLVNMPPSWGAVPTLHAVEDIPFTFDFTDNVSDPDTEIIELDLNTASTYVTDIDGMNVTFLFPNGVTAATVRLELSDGSFNAIKDVTFTILPVNDPPEHDVKMEWIATEEVPLTIDLRPNIWDVDNELSELNVSTEDIYASLSEFNLTATFPEGILEYNMTVVLTDGEYQVDINLGFSVTPVNDPPIVAPLGSFIALEDEVSILNLTPYLSDVDTPVADLTVIVRSARCTAVGQELHFHYVRGGFNETILVQVTDGRTMVESFLEVWVEERNDGPIVHPITPQVFTEDKETTLDLKEFIEDEDTDYENITVTCDHPAIIDTEGLIISFNFTTWQPEETIFFNVSDGMLKAEGQFMAQVVEVNDPPLITGIGDLVSPVQIVVDEGSTEEFPITVVDEDDNNHKYALSTSWSGITVSADGIILVEALKGDVGEYTATMLVEDTFSATDSWDIVIKVLNVNDPPSLPNILKPSNHTIVDQGVNVTFSVSVDDPDIMFGQVMTVTWLSNISGTFMTLTSEVDLSFLKDDLPVGVHNITIHVTDGEHVREVWFILEVMEPYVAPPPPEKEPFLQTTSGIGLMILVVLAVVVVAVFLTTRSRKEDETEDKPRDEEEIIADVDDGSQKDEMAALGDELGRLADELEASMTVEADATARAPVAPPQEELEEVDLPSAETMADREHARQIREVMKALTQLPRGLPIYLSNKEMSQLASEITDGPKRTAPDGSQLVEIDGTWYNADHTATGRFLQVWKEEVSEDDDAKRVEQLEARLLEGKISEETYERLRKKYENS